MAKDEDYLGEDVSTRQSSPGSNGCIANRAQMRAVDEGEGMVELSCNETLRQRKPWTFVPEPLLNKEHYKPFYKRNPYLLVNKHRNNLTLGTFRWQCALLPHQSCH